MKNIGSDRFTRPISRWKVLLAVADDRSTPAFLRIARGLATEVRRGRLLPGSQLPGSRELADALGVHRNTALAAYRELAAEGFLETVVGRGTFIARELPQIDPEPAAGSATAEGSRTTPAFPLTMAPPPERTDIPPAAGLVLHGSIPDTSLVPRDALARAYRRALRSRRNLLDYGDPAGEFRFRSALAKMLGERRGLAIDADDVVVTRGSQMAISLVAAVLLQPNDVVAVEALGYRPAWRAFLQHGATLMPLPVDAHGLVVSALEELISRRPIRALYVTPHHQYPTAVSLSAARRMALLALARKHRFAIVEDDYDHEFHYDARPVLPLASADASGSVLYVGTLSKVLAPGLRVGYLVAPRPVRDAVVAARLDLDRQGDRLTESALAELMEDGEVQRHVWRASRVYKARRENAVAALAKLADWVSFDAPTGGLAVWATICDRRLSADAWHRAALKRGVVFQPGRYFTFDGSDLPAARFGFGAIDEAAFRKAVDVLRKAATEVRASRRVSIGRHRP